MNLTSRANLRPFQPGQSGNLNGRPKAYHTVLRLARANAPDAIRTLIQCMNDKRAPWPSRVAAANGLLDRALGKTNEYLKGIDAEHVASLTITIERAEQSPEPLAIDATPSPRPALTFDTVTSGSGDD